MGKTHNKYRNTKNKYKTKWITQKIFVDIDTGEVISKSQYERGHYIKLGSQENIEFKGNTGIKNYITHVRQNPQIRIKF